MKRSTPRAHESPAATAAPDPTSARALLGAHGLRPKKSFGQNFLNPEVAVKLAAIAQPERGGTAVEIGAGLGALTFPLAERTERSIAIERDRDLVPILRAETVRRLLSQKLEIVEADAKCVDYRSLFERGPRPYLLAGNLPYQITGPLLQLAVGLGPFLDRASFLVQLEVAERLTAQPGESAYGALSVFAQAAFSAKRELTVRPGSFFPVPGVDSAAVSLRPKERPIPETPRFRQLVKAAFQKRRKTLRNAWALLGDAELLERASHEAGISLRERGERLAADDFSRMAEALDQLAPPRSDA